MQIMDNQVNDPSSPSPPLHLLDPYYERLNVDEKLQFSPGTIVAFQHQDF